MGIDGNGAKLLVNTRTKSMVTQMVEVVLVLMMMMDVGEAGDKNGVFDPCSDAKVQILDGFTFGLAISAKESFFFNQTLLSPCDSRISLSDKTAQLAIFRPKVDEISLLTINTTGNPGPAASGGYMVAFAGRKYAARSQPVLVADGNHIITSFTLVLNFKEGVLQNLYWKNFGCSACSGDFVCLHNQDCAIKTSKCKSNGGPIECNIGIQLAFSGTDKNLDALNTWYEVKNLRQYSLFNLYTNIRDSLVGQYDKIF